MRKHIKIVIISFLVVLSFEGCHTEKNFIPSYLKIDSFNVDASSIGGNNVHQITTFQLYQNNQFLGTYPVPSQIPLDAEGKNNFIFAPYIKRNGNSQTYASYMVLNPLDTFISLSRNKTTNFTPKFVYRNNAKILWQEDFQNSTSTLIPISLTKGDTTQIVSRPFELNKRFGGTTKCFAATFTNNDSFKSMDLGCFDIFKNLPLNGVSVYLEFDIKTDLPVQLAIKRNSPTNGAEYVPYLFINPTGDVWKRFYVDLIYEIQGQAAGTTFQIVYSIDKPASFSGSREILFDNIRLSHLN
jgi:hypothetical protein